MSNSEENMTLELIEYLDFDLPCDLEPYHSDHTWGHDDGAGKFIVATSCATRFLCAGVVDRMRAENGLRCLRCMMPHFVDEMTITPIGGIS